MTGQDRVVFSISMDISDNIQLFSIIKASSLETEVIWPVNLKQEKLAKHAKMCYLSELFQKAVSGK